MNKWTEIFVGLVLVILAVLAWALNPWSWGLGEAALLFLKGGIMWLIIGIGALFILLGLSDLKE